MFSATSTTSSSSKDPSNRGHFGGQTASQSHHHHHLSFGPSLSLSHQMASLKPSLSSQPPSGTGALSLAPSSATTASSPSSNMISNNSGFYHDSFNTSSDFHPSQTSLSDQFYYQGSCFQNNYTASSANFYQGQGQYDDQISSIQNGGSSSSNYPYSSYHQQQQQQQSNQQHFSSSSSAQQQPFQHWSSSSAAMGGVPATTPTPAPSSASSNNAASGRYQFLNHSQSSASGFGLVNSRSSPALSGGGGNSKDLGSGGNNSYSAIASSSSASSSSAYIGRDGGAALSSISFDYTGTAPAPRESSPASNNSISGSGNNIASATLSSFANTGSYNTPMFQGSSGNNAVTTNSASFVSSVPSRPHSASSLLSLENHFASTSFFGVGPSNGGYSSNNNNNNSLFSSIISPTTSFNSGDGRSSSGLGNDSSFIDHHPHSLLPPQHRPSTPPDSSVSFEANSSIASTLLFDGGRAVGGSMVAGSSGNEGVASANNTDRPEAMRTLYFGNLPPDLPISTFLDHIRGGLLEECKYLASKNCVFVTFLEASVAAAVYLEYQQHPFTIDGYECRVGWGKPSTLHLSIRNHVLKGATRNVFLGNLDTDVFGEKELEQEFSAWGMVDCVRVIPEKRIGFVHLCSVGAAVKAVAALGHECGVESSKWWACRVYYGRDRCCTQSPPPVAPVFTYDGDSNTTPEENRTVYIGGIHADVTTKDLCDVIRGGLLQQVKYFPEKNICFATFISPSSAAAFYNRASTDGLVLRSKRMKIGWGKPSMLPLSIATAVEKGASRNVYIGSIDMDGYEGGEAEVKELLYNSFEVFGEIELVNIVVEKRIGFVCFTDIVSAIKAVEAMRAGNGDANAGKFNGLFRRVNFGKDRCAGPFRGPKNSVSPPPSPE